MPTIDGGAESLTDRQHRLFDLFYTTTRMGAVGLSDGGGPFGFDVAKAFIIDELMTAYDCDAVVETGTYLGDTLSFLGRAYPDLPVWSCDIDPCAVQIAAARLRHLPNVAVQVEESASCVARAAATFHRPFYYLDAHWYRWPLATELQHISCGIVAVDDFDIDDPRFAYDTYEGLRCDAAMVASACAGLSAMYCLDPSVDPLLPCLQVGRRSGVAFLAVGLPAEAMSGIRGIRCLSADRPQAQEDQCA